MRGGVSPGIPNTKRNVDASISPGSSGLGTRAVRWALVGSVLASTIYLAFALRPAQNEAALLTGCVLLTIAMILLTKPGEERLPQGRAFLTAGSALGSILFSLAGSDGPGSGLWAVDLGSYVFALLIVRGHPRVGGIAGSLAIAVILSWSVLRAPGLHETLLTIGHPIVSLIVGFVWLHALQRIADRSRRLGDESARAAFEAQVVEEAIAQSQREIAAIEARTAPLFARIASEAALSQDDRDEARVLEAELRDWLRSPDLAVAAVAAAAASARGRGVEVVLLGSPNPGDRAISASILVRIAELIGSAEHGRVTVRRSASARITVLIDTGALTTTRRWELSDHDAAH